MEVQQLQKPQVLGDSFSFNNNDNTNENEITNEEDNMTTENVTESNMTTDGLEEMEVNEDGSKDNVEETQACSSLVDINSLSEKKDDDNSVSLSAVDENILNRDDNNVVKENLISNSESGVTETTEANETFSSTDKKLEDSDEDIVEIEFVAGVGGSGKTEVLNTNISTTSGSSTDLKEPVAMKIVREDARSLRNRDKILADEMKFMADFDPLRSNRNQQKKRKRYSHTDGRLIHYADEYEECDCLQQNCPGCHYPCKSCGDTRCGHECRQNRRWIYEAIELEGRNIEIKNQRST